MRKIVAVCFIFVILLLILLWRSKIAENIYKFISKTQDELRIETVTRPSPEPAPDTVFETALPYTAAPFNTATPYSDTTIETASPYLDAAFETPLLSLAPAEQETPKAELAYIKKLREQYQNEDIIGYIKIDGTTIDYPVTQSTDNEFYLDHDIYKNKSDAGWIFLDYETDFARDDKNIVIYGHNMKKNIMFHGLRDYVSEDFFKSHRYISFNTIYNEYKWEIFSFYVSDINFRYTQIIFPTQEDFNNLISEMAERSLYDTGVTVTPQDRILTLSTCVSGSEDERYVLNARRRGD